MPAARRSTSTKRPFKEPAALRRLNKSLDSAHAALSELTKDSKGDVGGSARQLYKDLRGFVTNARRDTGKLGKALASDFDAAQKALTAQASKAATEAKRTATATAKRTAGTAKRTGTRTAKRTGSTTAKRTASATSKRTSGTTAKRTTGASKTTAAKRTTTAKRGTASRRTTATKRASK